MKISPQQDLRMIGKDIEARKEQTDKVASQFESMIIHEMFKSLRDTLPKDGMLSGGFGGSIFYDMMDQELSKQIADSGGLGFKDSIKRDLGDDSEIKNTKDFLKKVDKNE